MTTEKATPPGIALDNEALGKIYVECRECAVCQHTGINDASKTQAACHSCDWTGTSPSQDFCPGCESANCMGAACPKCGGIYKLLADASIAQARAAQPQPSRNPACLLNSEEMAAFRRFDECVQDGEGYDVPKQMMQRLAEIGVVQRRSGAYYQATEFGTAMLAAAPPPNFATRGAEPVGMQAAGLLAALKPFADAYAPEAARLEKFYTVEDKAKYGTSFDANTVTPGGINMGHFRLAYEAYHAAPRVAGMQAAHQAAIELASDTIDARNAEIAGLRAQLSAARRGQPTAAPTPHEQEARSAVLPPWPEPVCATDHEKATTAPWLTDKDIVDALHSLGIDTEMSKYGFAAIQVRGTNVPNIRRLVALLTQPTAQAGMLPVTQTDAARDVLAERRRQVEQEGGDK